MADLGDARQVVAKSLRDVRGCSRGFVVGDRVRIVKRIIGCPREGTLVSVAGRRATPSTRMWFVMFDDRLPDGALNPLRGAAVYPNEIELA